MKKAKLILLTILLSAIAGGILAANMNHFTSSRVVIKTRSVSTNGTVYSSTQEFCRTTAQVWITNTPPIVGAPPITTFTVAQTAATVVFTLQRADGSGITITVQVYSSCTLFANGYTTILI